MVFLSQFHLGVFAPNRGQVVDGSKLHLGRLFEYRARVVDLFVVFVKLGEGDPQLVQFADRLHWIDGLERFGECVDALARLLFVQIRSLNLGYKYRGGYCVGTKLRSQENVLSWQDLALARFCVRKYLQRHYECLIL